MDLTTLNEFIIAREKQFKYATGELSALLRDIRRASKVINNEVNRAALAGLHGAEGTTNESGEEQQKLDVFANDKLIEAFKAGDEVCGIASEEDETFVTFDNPNGKYVVLFDPLDGSSNIDVNITIGTIFAIYRRTSLEGAAQMEDFLQEGLEQVAAGYVVYGSSTMLVYTTGHGVNGFTLDPTLGEFYLTHPDMTFPANGKTYSVNEGNYNKMSQGLRSYIDNCKATSKSARYIGSLVADFHRNLIKGGVFMYPATEGSENGKLRLLYECNPLAFVAEQAGGAASNGSKRILELKPTELHQRTPVFIGSKEMVEEIEEYLSKAAV